MKAVVAAFNQEKALVGAFSVIVQLHRLTDLRHYTGTTKTVTSRPAPPSTRGRVCIHNNSVGYWGCFYEPS